jgi:hypothetical protein
MSGSDEWQWWVAVLNGGKESVTRSDLQTRVMACNTSDAFTRYFRATAFELNAAALAIKAAKCQLLVSGLARGLEEALAAVMHAPASTKEKLPERGPLWWKVYMALL